MSHDLEDVVCVLDGRSEFEGEITDAEQKIKDYICHRLRNLINASQCIQSLTGHLPGDAGSQARLPMLLDKLRRLTKLAP